MGELGVGEPGLQRLNVSLRLMQRPSRCAMRAALGVQRRFQFSTARFEGSRWIGVAAAVKDHNRNTAVLYKTMAWTSLVGTLLRRGAGRALKAQRTPHSAFSRLAVVRGQGKTFV